MTRKPTAAIQSTDSAPLEAKDDKEFAKKYPNCGELKKTQVEPARFYKAGYYVLTELWDIQNGDEPTPMRSAYNMRGDYIGNAIDGHRLCEKRGILPEKTSRDDSVCSIGYSVYDGKWYGWSHRAIFGFKVGSRITKTSCGYDPKKGEWEAKTMADALRMAKDFAEGVS